MKKICTMKRSCGSKWIPKVMTCIGRTHPPSGTRHTSNFPLKKRGTSAQYSYSDNSVRATASPPLLFLSSTLYEHG